MNSKNQCSKVGVPYHTGLLVFMPSVNELIEDFVLFIGG